MRWFGRFVNESFWVDLECVAESVLARRMNCVSLSVVHLVRRHQANAEVVMIAIVPLEKVTTKTLGILDTAESFWELRLIFHGFEVALREWIVV